MLSSVNIELLKFCRKIIFVLWRLQSWDHLFQERTRYELIGGGLLELALGIMLNSFIASFSLQSYFSLLLWNLSARNRTELTSHNNGSLSSLFLVFWWFYVTLPLLLLCFGIMEGTVTGHCDLYVLNTEMKSFFTKVCKPQTPCGMAGNGEQTFGMAGILIIA